LQTKQFRDKTFQLLYIRLMASLDSSGDKDLLTALNHPMRRRILRRMAGEAAISPREISEALDRPLSNVSYHVRVLAECNTVVLVGTRPVRGSMQHFYRSSLDAPWAIEVLEASRPEDAAEGETQESSGP
jgi:DNA-binding transcriptional ArsR family regulator